MGLSHWVGFGLWVDEIPRGIARGPGVYVTLPSVSTRLNAGLAGSEQAVLGVRELLEEIGR